MNPLNSLGVNNHGGAFMPAACQATMVSPGSSSDAPGKLPVPDLIPAHLNTAQQRMQLELLR
jgi:hypothetical protein